MKKFRRFLSWAIGFAMLVSVFASMTAVSAVELEVNDPNYDFANGYQASNDTVVENLDSYDGRKNVIHIKENSGNTSIGAMVSDEALVTDKYNFSFDFKSDMYKTGTSTGDFAFLTIHTKASTADILSGWLPTSFGTSSTGAMGMCFVNATAYDASYGVKENCQNNVWYHMDCIYDYDNQKIQLYCDGEKFAERAMFDGGETANAFIITSRQSDKSGGARGDVYFSNVKVNALGNQKITAAYDSANSTDSAISVKFSEKINDASGLKVVDSETLETVSTSATINGLTATIPVSNLKYGAEYRITIPEGITGLLGGTTTAQEILFNTADVTGSFGTHAFEDNFDGYTAVKNAGSEITDTNFTNNWPIVMNGGTQWGLGRYVWANNGNNVLRIDSWQVVNAKSLKTWHKFDQAYTDGVVEYNFDLAINDPNDTKYMTYTFGLHRGENAEPDHVFDISDGTIKLANSLGNNSSPETVTKLTMSGGLTDMVSFKVVEDLTNKKIKTYAKINDKYELLNSNPEGASISDYHYAGGGTTGLDFMTFKSGGSTLNTDTSMLIDNVTVDVGEPPMSAVVKKVRLGDDELTSKDSSAATTDIKVYFNQNMDATTLDNISIDAADSSAVDKDVTYDADTYCATLKLKGMLKAKTAYTINVPTTVKTADGRALARAYAGAFTTGEGTLFVSNPTLKNGDVDATKENTKEGNTLTAKVSVINQTGSSDDLVLILAAYDGDKLIDLKYDPKAYTAADTNFELTTTYKVPENVGDLNVQVMLWNGFNKMMPVKGAITLE